MTTLGFDFTRTIIKEHKTVTLQTAKSVFMKRFEMMKGINRKMGHYELLCSRALGTCGSGNDTIAKLGCRVQTSVNTERNGMLDALIAKEEIVDAQHELTTYDNMLHYILNESGLTEAQATLMEIVYFTGDRPVSFSEAVPIYKSKARISREFSRYDIQNELNRIFNNNIVPTLENMYNA